jgi:leucyl-tRNA synthetase
MSFNTAVAALMEALNGLVKVEHKGGKVWREAIADFTKLLAPFAPHIAEEVWREILGESGSIHVSDWPIWDEKLLVSDTMTIAVQVNGKLRGEIAVDVETIQADIEKRALELENVAKFIGDKKPARIIYVPGKIVNIVVK